MTHFPVIKQPGLDSDSPPASAEFKNAWSHTFTSTNHD